MKVTVIRTFLGNEGIKQEGDVIEVSEQRAAELEANGLVIGVVGGKMSPRVRTVPAGDKGAAVETVVDPTMPRPTGGQTGAVEPVSSSEVDPQPKKRTYRRRKTARKS